MGSGGKNIIDLTNQKFTRLTVLERVESRDGRAFWKCKCDCGNEVEVQGNLLRKGHTKSCGCLQKEKVAETGHQSIKWGNSPATSHKFFSKWYQIVERCHNSLHKQYYNYGGRGITVCDEWRDDPHKFLAWCDSHEPLPEGHSIDRIDNEKGYCPENCRFVTQHVQSRNTRRNVWVEYNGEKLVQNDFVKKYSVVPFRTALDRIYNGWNPIDAALTPRR